MREYIISSSKKFGNAYMDYMKRVPRINLIAGIIKQINRRK